MSQWHREHPELTGSENDPWMMHESYRMAIRDFERDCEGCGGYLRLDEDGLCARCRRDADS